MVAYDDTAAEGTIDALDLFDGSDSDDDLVFVGDAFRGLLDLDGDSEKSRWWSKTAARIRTPPPSPTSTLPR